MIRFALFGIPVAVDWWFWLIAVLLGGGLTARGPEDWSVVAVWVAVVFISIIVHELGHAVVGRRFGANPAIALHSFGGSTFLPGVEFSRKQSILVSAAGPAAGFLLGLAALGAAQVIGREPPLLRLAILNAIYVNLVWTFANLLPIQPLDGGQILREILGPKRIRLTSMIGFVLAVLLCFWALSTQRIFLAFMLAMFAYYNLQREPIQGGVVKDGGN